MTETPAQDGDARQTVSGTWRRPLAPPERCPDETDVLIIGGGIVGVSTAWFLAQRGIRVVVCEKGHIAGEQSGRNWGWVRVQGRDPREVPIMLDSLRIWPTLAERLGEDVGFVNGGCLYAARTDEELAGYERWLPTAREHGIDTRIISQQALCELIGESGKTWRGALYTPSDGRAEPHKAAPAIARAAERCGATILTACAVRGVVTSAGHVSGVVTEHGEIKTSSVLCAAGAWSSYFCGSLGIAIPQLKVRGMVVRTGPAEMPLRGNFFDSKVGIRRRQDGGYTVAHGSVLDHGLTPSTIRYTKKFLPALLRERGVLRVRFGKDFWDELTLPKRWALDRASPFETRRVLDPPVSSSVLSGIKRNLAVAFPELANVPIVEAWGGMVETTPDVVPVIGPDPSLPGFYHATGFSGHGFGFGPGAGKVIAEMLAGEIPSHDLSSFRLERFFDGSRLELQAAF